MYTHHQAVQDRKDAVFNRDLNANEEILRRLAVSRANEISVYDGGDRPRMVAELQKRGFRVEYYFAGIKVFI